MKAGVARTERPPRSKIRKNDTVMVIAGKDRGKTGKINRVLRADQRVVVAGVNIATKHVKNRPGVRQAGIIHVEAPLHVSNVMLVCPNCNKPTRVGFAFQEDGSKARVCKHCNQIVDKR